MKQCIYRYMKWFSKCYKLTLMLSSFFSINRFWYKLRFIYIFYKLNIQFQRYILYIHIVHTYVYFTDVVHCEFVYKEDGYLYKRNLRISLSDLCTYIYFYLRSIVFVTIYFYINIFMYLLYISINFIDV